MLDKIYTFVFISSLDGGLGTNAMLDSPVSVALDTKGNAFISDAGNKVIRQLNFTSQLISTVAGTVGIAGFSGDNGSATSASLSSFTNLAVNSRGNLIIADSNNNRVRLIFLGKSLGY